MKVAFVALALIALPAGAADIDIRGSAVLSAPGGRYVLGQISQFRRDQFLLDTQTGRVWTTVATDDKGDNVFFKPMPFIQDAPDGNYRPGERGFTPQTRPSAK